MRVFDTVKQRFSEVVGKQEGRTVTDPTGSAPVLSTGNNSQYVHNADWQEVQEDGKGRDEEVVVGYDPGQASIKYHADIMKLYEVKHTKGVHGVLRRWWIQIAAVVLTCLIWVVLGLGNAQYVSGYRPFSWDGSIIIAYLAGFGYEFGGIALVFVAAVRWDAKDYLGFGLALGGALVMALGSFYTQILYISVQIVRGEIVIPAIALSLLPFGVKSFVFIRSLIPNFLEFFLVFLVADKIPDVYKTIQERRRIQHEIHLLEQEDEERMQEKKRRDEHARQTAIANEATNSLVRAASDSMQQFAQVLVKNQNQLVQELKPRVIVQRIEAPPEDASEKKQPARATQRQSAPKQPVQQPIPLPQKPVSEPAVPKYSDDEIRRYMRMALARNAGATVEGARKIATQYGVDPDRVEKIFLEVKGDDASVQHPVSVASNGKHPVQQPDREQLTRMQTSSIDTSAMSATWEPVVIDDVPEDDKKDDDLPFV